ncbi:MAG: hypothetical protein ACO1TE_17380 [Prosthecobacter sp.]
MINAKTWQTVCGLVLYPFFLGAAATFLQPGHPWLIPIVKFFNIFFVALCALGACMGVLFCLRRLYFGCPFCRARSRVLGGSGKVLCVDCPSCGRVVVTCRLFRTATAELVGDEDEEDEE